MQTWDAIRARRNVRSYQTEPVPAAGLDRIAEAAWRAPSASNRQHWDFVIVTDPDQLRELSTVWRGAGHIAGAAAAIALIVPGTDDDRPRSGDLRHRGRRRRPGHRHRSFLGRRPGPGPQDPRRAR
jgi:nitroreductase